MRRRDDHAWLAVILLLVIAMVTLVCGHDLVWVTQ